MKKADSSFLDRVILHNKNADERLFDLILRSVTFIVLVIIIWLYADLVHVKADTLDISSYILGSNEYNLNGFWFNDDYIRMSQSFSDIPYNVSYPLPNVLWKNMKVTSEMDFDNYQFVMCCNSGSGGYESIFLIFIPKDVQVALLDSQRLYFMSECECPYVWTDFGHQNDTSYYSYRSTTFSSGLVDFSLSNALSSGSLTFFFGNIPYLKGSNVDAQNYFANGNDLYTCYNANYFMYDNLAKLPNSEEVESSKNHLALSDCQIGITAFDKSMTDLSESSVVIGLACEDNWILSHINDYTVLVQYDFYLKDSNLSQSDPVTMYSQTYPLSAFKTEPITESMANIMVNSMVAPFPSNRDFYSYYRSLNSTYGQKVSSERTFNYDGLIPTLINSYRNFFIGSYSTDNEVTPNNTIFEFYLDVNVRLSAQGESGGYYTKRFDFKRGTTSIISADAYQNPNPWEGESSPESEIDPNVPSGSSSSSGYGGSSAVAYGGNVTIYNNNNNSLVGSGSDTDTDTGIDNFLNVFNTFKSSFNEMSSVGTPQDNGFMGFLQASFGFIPGLNYIVICVGVVFSLIIILVIIRSLLL